ncbi:CidA/LrgA family protein [Xylanibacillus composti]|uniref:CidA/LrgA family protein n=1 Tax=Xylanibacillus composti TaxID=1572762 RepID=A0A8J4M329_9BACL|nr:CidA/LrgA family protein [Xylanibacillus composti]MDT9727088.1 CidA/LrgA family protein [Xylanibacillus composti]GIQ70354.1 hypothetical protein XYCOK13_31780 [Xylanibacillus composti]
MAGFAWLLAFWCAGEGIVRLFDLPLPGNVLGLLGMLAALHLKWLKLEWVEGAAQFLLSHMMLFFAPIVVGTMVFYPFLMKEWLPISLMLILGTLAAIAAAGAAAERFSQDKKGEEQHGQ